jgi:hypothetical protein
MHGLVDDDTAALSVSEGGAGSQGLSLRRADRPNSEVTIRNSVDTDGVPPQIDLRDGDSPTVDLTKVNPATADIDSFPLSTDTSFQHGNGGAGKKPDATKNTRKDTKSKPKGKGKGTKSKAKDPKSKSTKASKGSLGKPKSGKSSKTSSATTKNKKIKKQSLGAKKGDKKPTGTKRDRVSLVSQVSPSVRQSLRTSAKARGTSVEERVDTVVNTWRER